MLTLYQSVDSETSNQVHRTQVMQPSIQSVTYMRSTWQQSNKKRIDNLQRMRGAMDRKELPLSKREMAYILKCAWVMRVVDTRS